MLMVRVFLSWIPHNQYNKYILFIISFTEPILRPIRETLPISGAGIDLSPLVAFFLAGLLKKFLLFAL